jgi:hypothetical protein
MKQRLSATRVALVLFGALSLALACREVSAPDVPYTAEPFTPPDRFALWWRLTEACSGLTGDFAAVSWYVVPLTNTISYQGKQVDAYWIGDPDRIVLSNAHHEDGPTVRHEMLHALRHANGHPRDAFLTACGGVVACNGDCAAETGGYQAPSGGSPELQPSDVSPRVDVLTSLPSEVQDSGRVIVMTTITNPLNAPAWVRLKPKDSGDLVYQTFGIVVDNGSLASIATVFTEKSPAELFPLGAAETRHWVREEVFPRGTYGVRGYFNVDTLPRQLITLGQ